MPLSSVALFVVSVLASTTLLVAGFHFRQTRRDRGLDLYFYYLIATVSYGLVNWVGLVLSSHFAEAVGIRHPQGAVVIFAAVALPLVLVKVYLYVATLLALLDRKFPARASRAYWAVAAAILAVAAILIGVDLGSGSLDRLRPFLLVLGVVVLLVDFFITGYFLASAHNLVPDRRRRATVWFGWSYLIGYVVYSSPFYASFWFGRTVFTDALPYLYYLMHLAPLLPMARLAHSLPGHSAPIQASHSEAPHVIERFGISHREADVLRLVLAGLKNDEVAERLFISPHTVRNHLYSIYKKTSVKNRIQLMALCSRDPARDVDAH